MINKRIEDIQEIDIQALIDNKVLEGKTVEYKKELPNNSDLSKKEFLADITSFANTNGGDLIFGIEEDTATREPRSLIGLKIESIDKEKARLDNIIRTGVEPRLLNITIKPIPLSNSRYAILIRAPRSWISPHRVIFGGHAKFYARNSSGKYEMDVDELRVAFNLSETIIAKIRNFRIDRISKILADETPVPLFSHPKVALHIIAVEALQPAQKYNIDSIYTNRYDKLSLLYGLVEDGRFNLDGIVTYSRVEDGIYGGYTQLYRNGIIEAVDSQMLKLCSDREGNTLKIIHGRALEEKLIKSMSAYLHLMSELQIETPIFAFLSLLNIKGYRITTGERFGQFSKHSIERDLIMLPETIIENYDRKAETILKSVFDLIWNTCGMPRSLNFDENGNWIEKS